MNIHALFRAAVLTALFAGAAFAAHADEGRIQPWPENPFFWEYQGEPVLLLGGSREDNLFNHPEGLEEHLDTIAAAGGNYLRNTMSDRNPETRFAFAEEDEGLYDLDQWDEEYWERFDNFLRMCYERDIIVQIEVWDPWDLFLREGVRDYCDNRGWESHPYNPLNNVNYTAEESGLAEEIDYHSSSSPSDHAFFHTVPAMDDNELVRQYQEAFVNRILDFSLQYPNVLYCMNNEIGEDPEWGRYWARFIRERAEAEGVDVYLADMRRNHNFNSQEQIDLLHDDEHYDFFEISQNNAISGQRHVNQIVTVRGRRLDDPKPLNNVKIYGGGEAVRRFWRNVLGGCASARFHRPGEGDANFGIGANDLALDHMSSVRALMEEVGWPDIEPDLSFARLPVEHAGTVRTEKTHVVYTRDAEGQARLFIDGHEAVSGDIGGDMSGWDTDMRLALGNEFVDEQRGWRGAYHGLAIYDRALDASEIADHYAAGAPEHLDGLQARYAFDEGDGAVVHDVSGQEPALDLHIEDAGAVSWLDDGLERMDSVLIATENPAERLTAAIQESNAITVEAWITPAEAVQTGPARIVTLSQDRLNRNFTLGHDEDVYEMRLRTTETSENGLPGLITGSDAAASIAAARSSERDRAVIFVSHGALLDVDMDELAERLSAEWFEPRTADRQDAEPNENGYFQPPSNGDWLLVVQ